MRKLVLAALFATLAIPAAAQQRRAWNTEIGIQGGYARVEPTGGGGADHIDFFDVPGQSYVGGILTYGALYVIIPVGNKLALEPTFNLAHLTTADAAGGGTALATRLGLRLNFALTDKVYAAAGGKLLYIDQDPGQNGSQFGVQAAAGYRFRLSSAFNARAEFSITASDEADVVGSNAVYAVLFGLSTRIGGAAAAPARRAADTRRWQPRLGILGGYSTASQPEGESVTTWVSLPLIGGSISSIAQQVASPPTMFLVFPVGRKTAIEAGFDLHRVQQASGPTTRASANLSGRVLVAVTGNWYAAGGLNLNYLKSSGVDGGFITGANLGWGYEFPVHRTLRGRVELNYQSMKENADLAAGAQNVASILFALTMPLK